MKTYQEVVAQLSGNSLKDYEAAVDYLRDGYRNNSLGFALSQEVMERATGVFMFEKWAEWEELKETIESAMEIIPGYLSLLDDFADSHLLRGLTTFVQGLTEGNADVTGFFVVIGPWVIVGATGFQDLASKVEAQDPVHAARLLRCHDTLMRIEGAKFSMAYFLAEIRDWTNEMADGVYNVMSQADARDVFRIISSLSSSSDDGTVYDLVMERYCGLFRDAEERYSEAGDHEKVMEVRALVRSIEKEFLQDDEDDEDEDDDEEYDDDEDDDDDINDEDEEDGEAEYDDEYVYDGEWQGVEGFRDSEVPPGRSAMNTEFILEMAKADGPLPAGELKEALANHKVFLENGGGGGTFEMFDVAGLPLNIYSEDVGEGVQLSLNKKMLSPDAEVENADMTYADMAGLFAEGVSFAGADLSGSLLTYGFFANADFSGAKLTGTDFTGSDLRNASFRNADFGYTDFEISNCSGADFTGANLEQASFKGAQLDGVKR